MVKYIAHYKIQIKRMDAWGDCYFKNQILQIEVGSELGRNRALLLLFMHTIAITNLNKAAEKPSSIL